MVGTRPQFIKLAPLSKELRKKGREVIVDTGQHYDDNLASSFLKEFGIPEPDYSLGVRSWSHSKQTGKILIKVEEVLLEERPDFVIVFGDTNSTLGGALAASKLRIPVGHVEAGLRSRDMTMPEEVNRVVTDHISQVLFCPTKVSKENLRNEGICRNVHLVGDVMVDALVQSKNAAARHSQVLKTFGLARGEYQLLTVHRPANTDIRKNLKGILEAVSSSGVMTIFPMHPRTARRIREYEMKRYLSGCVRAIAPQNHMDTVTLVGNAKRVLTDSGGLQKEAYLLGTPCITLRETTEWKETVEAKWNVLVGADTRRISEAISRLVPPPSRPNVFGRPGAGMRIAAIVDRFVKHSRL